MEVLMSGNVEVLAMMYMLSESGNAVFDQKVDRDRLRATVARFRAEFSSEDVSMRPSTFNHRCESSKATMIYNTMYNSLARLSREELDMIDGRRECDRETRARLLEMGFCVLDGIDERSNYERWRRAARGNLQHLSVNMTTTLKCNARCEYCYERGVKAVDFDESRLEALIKFIERHKRRQPVRLNWFGDEPLMNPKMIDYVTRRVDELGIEYSSFIITNGSLLTRRMIEKKFPQWHVRGLQITLDGTAETYEARKNYVGGAQNMFERVLNRIEWVSEAGMPVDIRLNIDRDNADEVLDLVYRLQCRFDGNEKVSYYPAFVTGVECKLSEAEKILYVRWMLRALANPNKFNMTTRLYSMPRVLPCMRCDPQSFSVDVFGRVYNCEHLVGRKEQSLGTVKRLSRAKNEARLDEELREDCKECVFLPKCMGGCASNLRTDDAPCLIERYMIPAYVEYLCE